jgi:23S rRNA U2552 (ribose-2'-O)-methylase RlmE/FtsJ
MMDDSAEEDDGTEPMDPAEAMLQRGAVLRKLRELEREDEAARAAPSSQDDGDDNNLNNETGDNDADAEEEEDPIVLTCGAKVLSYDSYLRHQRYYDDLKHVDCRFIDYGNIGPGRLIVEQDKSLGKGGWCWDAAFVLGEYMIQNAPDWKIKCSCNDDDESKSISTSVLELGTGTGLCGALVAKAVSGVHVSLTDLPALMPFLQRNVARNFASENILTQTGDPIGPDADNDDDGILSDYAGGEDDDDDAKRSHSSVSAFPLAWGASEYSTHGTFDVVMGADVVASLYDPVALAQTIWSLAHSKSIVYVSFKERLSSVHRAFEEELQSLFDHMEIVKPSGSRNRNPDIRILIARGKNKL